MELAIGEATGPEEPVPGKRERTKRHNREAILEAAREVFAEVGYGAATVRDIVRRTPLATGTFYNYFPDKESVLRALVSDNAAVLRERTRAARERAGTVEEFVGDAYRETFAFVASDPATFQLLRRNAGTIRTLMDEPLLGAAAEELLEDLRKGIRCGDLPEHDAEYMAAAMVGVAFELAVRMVEDDPIDPDRATRFATELFLGALERRPRPPSGG